jgi:hypothetical protein
VLLYKPLGSLPAIGINIFVRTVVRIGVAVEAPARIRIGGHRINAQEASGLREFAVSAAIFPSPFKNLAWFSPGQLGLKAQIFRIRDSGSRTRARQAVCLPVY